jgi:nicotinate dehydrogenase subunit A
VVRATALLEEQPDASAEQVAQALERNLCRCGTQQRIVEAVLAAQEAAS